jgi:hypothetical protein
MVQAGPPHVAALKGSNVASPSNMRQGWAMMQDLCFKGQWGLEAGLNGTRKLDRGYYDATSTNNQDPSGWLVSKSRSTNDTRKRGRFFKGQSRSRARIGIGSEALTLLEGWRGLTLTNYDDSNLRSQPCTPSDRIPHRHMLSAAPSFKPINDVIGQRGVQ